LAGAGQAEANHAVAGAADFLVGGHGLGLGPLVGVDGGKQPLMGTQQVCEVDPKVG
jgi:hypothetical protein